jgi:hypothetical protein
LKDDLQNVKIRDSAYGLWDGHVPYVPGLIQGTGQARRNDCSRSKSIAKSQKLAIKSLGGELPWAKVH